jgi:viroplasmin and RNaseH domain-containing protein
MTSKGNKWYAVREGRETGIYSNWDSAREQVHGYSNNEHR